MARLSVSVDDETIQELSNLDVEETRGVLAQAMEILPADQASCVARLSRSMAELGPYPSAAAVVREAVGVYFDLLRDAEEAVTLQVGYKQLADDVERSEIVEVMSKRAPERWGSED